MKHVVLVLFGLALVGPWAQAQTGPPVVSVAIDVVSLSYNQLLVYTEVPLTETLSVDVALGYSPGGLWSSDARYAYVQTDLRTYLSGAQGWYTGFGFASYFGQAPFAFTRWKTTLAGSSSVVVGVVGEVGYRAFFRERPGFFVDSNVFGYALVPLQVDLTTGSRAEFPYSQFSALGSVLVGWAF